MVTPGIPLLILCLQMTEGRINSIRNTAASAGTGGGARDLRVGSYEVVRPFVRRLLLGVDVSHADPGGVIESRFTWGDGTMEHDIEFHPPTATRSAEGRFSRVYSWQPLRDLPVAVQTGGNPKDWAVLFVRDDNGLLWVRYASLGGLRLCVSPVKDCIPDWLDKGQQSSSAAVGYIDLTAGFRSWCNLDY